MSSRSVYDGGNILFWSEPSAGKMLLFETNAKIGTPVLLTTPKIDTAERARVATSYRWRGAKEKGAPGCY